MSMPELQRQHDTEAPTSSVDLLVQFLHERDANCPVCGYNLRNLTSPRCPECGREIVLTVGAVEPPIRPWLIAMVSMCACAGIGMLFLLVIILDGLPPTPLWRLAVVMFILAIPLAGVLIVAHGSFRRMREASQRGFALASVIYAAISTFLLILTIAK